MKKKLFLVAAALALLVCLLSMLASCGHLRLEFGDLGGLPDGNLPDVDLPGGGTTDGGTTDGGTTDGGTTDGGTTDGGTTDGGTTDGGTTDGGTSDGGSGSGSLFPHTHTPSEWLVDQAPTCMKTGTRHRECTVCGKTLSTETLAVVATAHNYASDWTSDGDNHWHKCQNSGCTSVKDKTSHTFGAWVVDKAATCVSSGTRHHDCTVCNKSVSESYTDTTAHNYASDWTSDGTNHWHRCQNSGCTSVSGKTSHTFGAWVVDKAPTCSATGVRHRDCTVCGKTASEAIPTTAHAYSSIYSADATYIYRACTEKGCTATSKTAHNMTFSVSGGKATLKGYKGSAASVIIPSTYNGNPVTSIDNGAFYVCYSLTSITIPNSVTSIGYEAFYNCPSLSSITVDENNPVYHSAGNCLIETGSKTLIAGCKSSVIPSDGSVTSIGSDAFRYCHSLTSITIPNGVTSIGDAAFIGCSKLTSITIPNSVTSIGSSAFWSCDSLTSIMIPNSVTSIGSNAFRDCYSLTSITIGNSVTSIGSFAFYSCSGLTGITIPNSVTSIGYYAFYDCDSLSSITVDKNNTVYHSAGNCLIATKSKTLIAGCKSSVIPSDGSVTSIGSYAFYSCDSLTSITIPNSVTSIGSSVFEGCESLTSITIPDSVTSIGYNAFYDCDSLTSITIPNSVTRIGSYAFYNCDSLTSIHFNGTKAQWNAISKGSSWNYKTGAYKIYCTDGTLSK